MNNIEKIKSDIAVDLEKFNEMFDAAFSTSDALLKRVLDHIRHQKGKQIRPILVIHFAKLLGTVNENTLRGASAIEMLHTASLVHDDVVDESYKRRNLPSVNAVFDNRKAVLVGDYLLSKAMQFMSSTNDIGLINVLTNISIDITRGELLQLQCAYNLPTEEQYTEIIRCKTAILFATCANIASFAAKASAEQHKALEEFGTNLGLCFQIKDDILDYTKGAEIGKPTFNDVREGKISLPLIHTLNNMPEDERVETLQSISNGDFNDEFFNDLNNNILKHKGIEYATERMEMYRTKAIAKLDIFGDSDEKTALLNIANYVLDRKN